jgi:sec-independent protein translocase protein TatA
MHVSVTQLLIILVIVIVLFGTKKLRNVGADLGGAIKNFRASVKDNEEDRKHAEHKGETIEGEVTFKKSEKV